MSLMGALNIGQSALAVQQAAIQVTGNNIANASNADYTRQTAQITPNAPQQMQPGIFQGTGVELTAIQRQVDEALNNRLRGATSDAASASSTADWLGRVQSAFNELSGQDLSTQLSTFFNSWSNLANTPQDTGLRQVVLQNGQSLASWMQNVRGQLTNLQDDAGSQLKTYADNADQLSQQIADLNAQIVAAEGGTGGTANGLRDQRDAALKQLSQLMDVQTVPQSNGSVNVYVGSEVLVMGADSRGVAVQQSAVDGQSVYKVVFKRDGGTLNAASGQIGALQTVLPQMQGTVNQLDKIANSLIFELNKLHSSGQGLDGFSSVTATNSVNDATKALNDPAAGLKFTAKSGSFVVHVTQKDTGLSTSTLVRVDLKGQPGDTTLNSLAAQLNTINGVTATVSGGQLTVSSDSSQEQISFSQDSSGVLAALGVNNFFTGSDARTIGVNQTLISQPSLLAAAANGNPGDNQTAVAIAALESTAVSTLKGQTLKDNYQGMINAIATGVSSAKSAADAASNIRDTLESQRDSLSGVSLDEEAINLVRQQRAYQAAARLVSTIDDMLKTILAIT